MVTIASEELAALTFGYKCLKMEVSCSLRETSNVCRIWVGFEVLTSVVMKSAVFWDITQCNPLKVNRRFGGTSRFYLLGRRISFHGGFLFGLFFDPEDGDNMFLRNI
jgi:hypothetical protein